MQREVWEQLTHKTFTLPGPSPALLHQLAPQSRILDVGCGYGRLLQAPDLQAHQLIGVDGAVGMLRRARYEAGMREFGTWGMFRSSDPSRGVVRHFFPADLRRLLADVYVTDWQEQTRPTMNGNAARSVTIVAKNNS